jgi:hypothetical protein
MGNSTTSFASVVLNPKPLMVIVVGAGDAGPQSGLKLRIRGVPVVTRSIAVMLPAAS